MYSYKWDNVISNQLKTEWLKSRADKVVDMLQIALKKEVKPNDTILEIGGGAGHNIKFLGYPTPYIDVDISPHMLKQARQIVKGNFINGDGSELPIKSDSIDVVLCSDVLVHCPNYPYIINEIWRITKKKLIIRAVVRLEGKTVNDINLAYQKKENTIFPYIVINYNEFIKRLSNLSPKGIIIDSYYRPYGKMDKYTFLKDKPKDISIVVVTLYKKDNCKNKGKLTKPLMYKIKSAIEYIIL